MMNDDERRTLKAVGNFMEAVFIGFWLLVIGVSIGVILIVFNSCEQGFNRSELDHHPRQSQDRQPMSAEEFDRLIEDERVQEVR